MCVQKYCLSIVCIQCLYGLSERKCIQVLSVYRLCVCVVGVCAAEVLSIYNVYTVCLSVSVSKYLECNAYLRVCCRCV